MSPLIVSIWVGLGSSSPNIDWISCKLFPFVSGTKNTVKTAIAMLTWRNTNIMIRISSVLDSISYQSKEGIHSWWSKILESEREKLDHSKNTNESHGHGDSWGDPLHLAGAELPEQKPGDCPHSGSEYWKQSQDVTFPGLVLIHLRCRESLRAPAKYQTPWAASLLTPSIHFPPSQCPSCFVHFADNDPEV